MNDPRVSRALRREVRERARGSCEYCRLSEDQAFFPHEPDHIIATKHGGQTTLENLAFACFDCNRFKGANIASIDPASGKLTPLLNPRTQEWDHHFRTSEGFITPLTDIGRVTELIMRLNLPNRVEVRAILAKIQRYPPW